MKNRPIELGWNMTGGGDEGFQGVLAPISLKALGDFYPYTSFLFEHFVTQTRAVCAGSSEWRSLNIPLCVRIGCKVPWTLEIPDWNRTVIGRLQGNSTLEANIVCFYGWSQVFFLE